MTRSFLGRTTLALLVTAICIVVAATVFLVWPHWQRYRAVKALVEFVTFKPCVCIYSRDRNNQTVLKSDPVLEQHVQKVKRWRGTQDAAESLTILLHDKTLFEDVRRNAAYTLGLFPEETTTVVPALTQAHHDNYSNVFDAAHWALKNVDSEAYARAPTSWPAGKQ